jgi:hypothetical protein
VLVDLKKQVASCDDKIDQYTNKIVKLETDMKTLMQAKKTKEAKNKVKEIKLYKDQLMVLENKRSFMNETQI